MFGRRSRGASLLTLVYVIVGVAIAANHNYFDHIHGWRGVLSAVLAVFLWPLLLLGIDLHVRLSARPPLVAEAEEPLRHREMRSGEHCGRSRLSPRASSSCSSPRQRRRRATGTFRSSDAQLNAIWAGSVRTAQDMLSPGPLTVDSPVGPARSICRS